MATAAGVGGIGLAIAVAIVYPAPFNVVRLALFLAGVASLVAGAAPSRRVRFVLLAVAVPTLVIVGVLGLFTIGIAVLVIAAIAAYGLFIEYAREGR